MLWKYTANLQQNNHAEKSDFNKVAKQLCWNHTSAWVYPVNFLYIFITPFPKNTSGRLLLSQRSCLYDKNHPTQVRRLTWVRSRQNGVFHFVKANRLYENGFIPPSWDLTSTQVRSHLGGMIFLHVNSFCQAVPPRQDCSFSLDSVCFYNYYVKKCNSSYKI